MPEVVYCTIATAGGRAYFWAESAEQTGGAIPLHVPNGRSRIGRVLVTNPPRRFGVVYLGGSACRFTLAHDGRGGTDPTLTDDGVAPDDQTETHAGWVSVPMALKAAVDFGIDLRNRDPVPTWHPGYVDNRT